MSELSILFALLAVRFFATAAEVEPASPSLISSVQVLSPKGGQVDSDVLTTKPGTHLDPGTITHDIHALYATHRLHDVQVKITQLDIAPVVTFIVVPQQQRLLRNVHFEPPDFPYRPELATAIPVDAVVARKLGGDLRKQLLQRGYQGPRVEPELIPVAGRNEADLLFHVTAGNPAKLRNINLIGEPALDSKEIRGAIHNLKTTRIIPGIPGLWDGIRLHQNLSDVALDADVASVSSLYFSRGYFDAVVRRDKVQSSAAEASVDLRLQPGKPYTVRRWTVQGPGITTRSQLVKGVFRADDFCGCLFGLRRESEKLGHPDWNVHVRLQQSDLNGGDRQSVDLIATVDPGQAFTVRRISFYGHRRYSDRFVRANFLLDEAQAFDPTLLRKGIARLNQSRVFAPVNESNVEVRTDSQSGTADIRVNLREQKLGSWLISGPVGPSSVSGPLQFKLASRLPRWGSGILEASTWLASVSLMPQADPLTRLLTGSSRSILPIVSVQRPFTPGEGWKSGFAIAPQLSLKTMALIYAGTQMRDRLLPLLQGNKAFTPVLPLTIQRENDNVVMLCQPPDPRFKWLRIGTSLALQFVSSFPML